MPRPKREGAAPPKTRSRFGCWPCKEKKIKCGEEKPACTNCARSHQTCDYSIRLNWTGRTKNRADGFFFNAAQSLPSSPASIVFPSPEVFSGSGPSSPTASQQTFSADAKKIATRHARSRSHLSTLPPDNSWMMDPELLQLSRSNPTSSHLAPDSGFGRTGDGRIFASRTSPGINDNVTSRPLEGRPQHLRPLSWGYPSPSMSSGSPNFTNEMMISGPKSPGQNLPSFKPMASTSPQMRVHFPNEEYVLSADRNKRMRLGGQGESSPMGAPTLNYDSSQDTQSGASPMSIARSPNMPFLAPSPFSGTPQTPGSSTSDDRFGGTQNLIPGQLQPSQGESRRGSVPVSSLLIDNPPESKATLSRYPVREPLSTFYGYDKGYPDRDIPDNDDMSAILGSPAIAQSTFDGAPPEQTETIAFEPGGYYGNPVPIKIPNPLLPLPGQLLANSMNLLYFHHFLNHTARILVPHDCAMNPYRTVLPNMAVHDEDLLNLLLAYSASHRARLLNHPEPAKRIARWVEDVFPKLRNVLQNPNLISIKNIATATMLASLEIISPRAFGVDIPWRVHLAVAREMFSARDAYQTVHFEDSDFFLARWFAYLDVLGSLSGSKSPAPLSFEIYWPQSKFAAEDEIDCLLGFTSRYIRILGNVASLVKECEPERLDEHNRVRPNWIPTADTEQKARSLLAALHDSRRRPARPCLHRGPPTDDAEADDSLDSQEVIATNELYHWAGIIQVLRRTLDIPTDSNEVREAVSAVVEKLEMIRAGSSAEACLLFPMFTAGCEARDGEQRRKIMGRLKDVESFGMRQVVQGKRLMEKVWQLDVVPWESLVEEEFIG